MRKGKLLSPSRPARNSITRSRRQEDAIAARSGGKTKPGSGNQWHSKGDVEDDGWLTEAKTTEDASWTLKLSDLQKLNAQAVMAGKQAVYTVEFGSRQFAIVDWELFEEMRELWDRSGSN